jgi:hypothetical protein
MLTNMITVVCTVNKLRSYERERYDSIDPLTSSIDDISVIEQPIILKFRK